MSLAANPYWQYKQNDVQGASPGYLTLMLYDGLVKFLKLALKSIEEKDIGGSHYSLIRAQAIIAHLNETLDHKYKISQNLAALYDFMIQRLLQANAKKDAQMIGEVLGLAEDLRDTWRQAVKLARETGL